MRRTHEEIATWAINEKYGKFDKTVLHIASRRGHIEVVKALLESDKFSEANAQGTNGWTALDLTADVEIKNVIRKYLKKKN